MSLVIDSRAAWIGIVTWLHEGCGLDDRGNRIENLLREQIQQATEHANAVRARLTIIALLLTSILFFVSQ